MRSAGGGKGEMSNHYNCRQKDNNRAIKAGFYDSIWQCYLLSQVLLAAPLTDKGALTPRRLGSRSLRARVRLTFPEPPLPTRHPADTA